MTQPTISLVIASHIGAPTPTSASYIGDGSTTSASHFDNPHLAATSHARGITLFTMIHINVTSPTSVYHVGYYSLSHIESLSLAIGNDTRGIEKPRRLRSNPKFLCRTCKGDHLTRLCPNTTMIPAVWFSPEGPLGSEVSVVSPHPFSPLIDIEFMLL
jgi:hypothetical protein